MATDTKSVASFISLMRGNSIAIASRYWFTITEAPSGMSLTDDQKNSLSYKCHKVVVPGSEITTDDVWFPQMNEAIAKGRKYEDITCTFYCTDGMPEIATFDKWMSLIYNTDYARIAFKNTYAGKATIEQLNKNGETKGKWTFTDIFPTKISSMSMAYESRNTILTFDVTFSYRFWEYSTSS